MANDMNVKEAAENTWFKLSFRVAMMVATGLVASWEYQSRQDALDVKQSISDLNHSLDDFKEKQFNPLANSVVVLQTTLDKGVNQALEGYGRRLDVVERRLDALNDRVNEVGQTPLKR